MTKEKTPNAWDEEVARAVAETAIEEAESGRPFTKGDVLRRARRRLERRANPTERRYRSWGFK